MQETVSNADGLQPARRAPWEPDEISRLRDGVDEWEANKPVGTSKWVWIAAKVGTRDKDQCESRWSNWQQAQRKQKKAEDKAGGSTDLQQPIAPAQSLVGDPLTEDSLAGILDYIVTAQVDGGGANPQFSSGVDASSSLFTGLLTGGQPGSTTIVRSTSASLLPREAVTICIEGDISDFTEERDRKLMNVLASELDIEAKSIKFDKPPLPEARARRIGTKRCRLKVTYDERGIQFCDDDGASDGGCSTSSPSSSTGSSVTERDIEHMIESKHWPAGLDVIDIEIIDMSRGSVLLVLSLPAPAGNILMQLAQQRVQALVDEKIRCCKLYGTPKVARLDGGADIEARVKSLFVTEERVRSTIERVLAEAEQRAREAEAANAKAAESVELVAETLVEKAEVAAATYKQLGEAPLALDSLQHTLDSIRSKDVPPPDPPPAEEAVWEVCLSGRFEPYGAAECTRLEAAYLRGEESVSVRGGLCEVTLRDPPYMQRAAHAHAPRKQREVRRRVVSAGAAPAVQYRASDECDEDEALAAAIALSLATAPAEAPLVAAPPDEVGDSAASDDELIANAMDQLARGNTAMQTGNPEGAVTSYTLAILTAEDIREPERRRQVLEPVQSNLGRACFELAKQLFAQGQTEDAIASCRDALDYALESGNRIGQVNALKRLGIHYWQQQQYSLVVEYLTPFLAICKSEKLDDSDVVSVMKSLHFSHHEQAKARRHGGEYLRAIEHWKLAASLSHEAGDVSHEARYLGNIGRHYADMGQYDCALEHCEKALACAPAGDLITHGNLKQAMGDVCTALGEYERALKYCTQALDDTQTAQALGIGDKDQRAQASQLSSIGNIYFALGQSERAIDTHMQALEICNALGDKQQVCDTLIFLSNALGRWKSHDTVIDFCCRALAIAREIGAHDSASRALSFLADAHRQLGEYALATTECTQALALHRSSRPPEGSDREGQALHLGTTLHLSTTLGRILIEQGNSQQARECFKEAHQIASELGDRHSVSGNLLDLALAAQALGDHAHAIEYGAEALDVYDTLWAELKTDERRITFGDTFTCAVRFLQSACWQFGRRDSALEQAERSRSRAFELLLAQQRIALASTGRLVTEVTSDPIGCTGTEGAAGVQLRVGDLHAIAARQGVTILVYSHVAEFTLFAWLVRSTGAPLRSIEVSIPKDESLTHLIELTRQTLGAAKRHAATSASVRQGAASEPRAGGLRAPSADDEAAIAAALAASARDGSAAEATSLRKLLSRCHDMLISPLGLVDDEALLIIPDRDLYALPFAALLDSNGKHLIERHSMRVAPSVGTVFELERRATARGPEPSSPSALVVGVSTFGNGWASELNGARREAKHVSSVLDASDAYEDAVHKLITPKDNVSKAAVIDAMHGRDIIHLATHGEPTGVLLDGPTRKAGTLSMGEVQALDLSARLVVLSECDSFRGELSSDGVIGITRAFVAAGALTLVASLWKVDDGATLELMKRFYNVLLENERMGDVAAALQQAMVSMIREGKWSVLQWAGFVVYGLGSAPSEEPQLGESELSRFFKKHRTRGSSGEEHALCVDVVDAPPEASASTTRSDDAMDDVQYAVTGPAMVEVDQLLFTLQVWAMVEQYVERFERALERLLQQGDKQHRMGFEELGARVSELVVYVEVDGCQVEPHSRTVPWNRKISSSSHDVSVPADFASSSFQCSVDITAKGMPTLGDYSAFHESFRIARGGASSVATLLAANASLKARVEHLEEQMSTIEQSLLSFSTDQQSFNRQLREDVRTQQDAIRPLQMTGQPLDRLNEKVVALGVGFGASLPVVQLGSGFFVHPDGYLITDHHVLTDMDYTPAPVTVAGTERRCDECIT